MKTIHQYTKNRMKHASKFSCMIIWVLCMTMLFSSCALASATTKVTASHDMTLHTTQAWHIAHPTSSLPSPPTDISARSGLLMRADTGEILWEQSPHTRLSPASTTKIMTALIAVEMLPLDTPIQIPQEAVGIEGSSVYLTVGEVLTLEDLLYALMLASANDAAVAIALSCAPTLADFAILMNQKALSLGLQNTHFVNPHGLYHPEHYTSAYDLSCITREAISHPSLCTIMSTQKATIPKGDSGVRFLVNHNKLLRTYEGVVGGKTGYTKKSGRCLVSVAKRDTLPLIAVTLNAPNDWHDHASLLDYGFGLFDHVTLCADRDFDMPLPLISGEMDYVMVGNLEGLSCPLYKGYGDITYVIELPRMVYAPIHQGRVLGQVVFYIQTPHGDKQRLGSVALYALHDAKKLTYQASLKDRLKDLFAK